MAARWDLAIARRTYAGWLHHVVSRNELPLVLNSRRLLGSAVEVGVFRGDFSAHLLRWWRGAQLISIDPWVEQPELWDWGPPQHVQDEYYRETARKLAPFGRRSVIWRAFSVDASRYVRPGSLDFVYIDALHDAASVTADLHSWFDKVRPGGIIAGHDYFDVRNGRGIPEVKRAVDRFFAARGLRVYTTHEPIEFLTWIVEIPHRVPVPAHLYAR